MPAQSNFQRADAERRKRRRAHDHGRHAEIFAAIYRLKGYRILARRYRVNGGEIDLIAIKSDAVAFIEVKMRPNLLEARLAIDATKRRRMSRAVKVWLAANPGPCKEYCAAMLWRLHPGAGRITTVQPSNSISDNSAPA